MDSKGGFELANPIASNARGAKIIFEMVGTSSGLSTPKNQTLVSKEAQTIILTTQDLEEFLAKHTNKILSQVQNEISCLRDDLATKTALIEQILAKLENFDKVVSDLDHRVVKIEGALINSSADNSLSGSELANIKTRCVPLERTTISTDAVIFDIPQVPNEDLKMVFLQLCRTVSCKPLVLKNIFRSRQETPNDPPIILKFSTVRIGTQFLKQLLFTAFIKENSCAKKTWEWTQTRTYTSASHN